MFSPALKHVEDFINNKHASAAVALIGHENRTAALEAYGCFSFASASPPAIFSLRPRFYQPICRAIDTL